MISENEHHFPVSLFSRRLHRLISLLENIDIPHDNDGVEGDDRTENDQRRNAFSNETYSFVIIKES